MDNVQKNTRVKYSLGKNIKTKFVGIVQRRTRRLVWIIPERASGKFVSKCLKNEICIKRKFVEAI